MYSEVLNPAKEERTVNLICLAAAILILLGMPYIYDICLGMPKILAECIMIGSYAALILLFYRVYTRFVCGYRYIVILEKQTQVLPRNMGTVSLKTGSILIERMYGSKGNLAAIIVPEEIKGICLYTDKKYTDFIKKTSLLNRKLFTNRGRKNMYVLMYERKGKKHYCLISPSETLLKNMAEVGIL